MMYICWFLCLLWRKMALKWIGAFQSRANCPCPALDIIFTADKLPSEPGSMPVSFSHAYTHIYKRLHTPMRSKIYTKSHQQVDCISKRLFIQDNAHIVTHRQPHSHGYSLTSRLLSHTQDLAVRCSRFYTQGIMYP